MVWATNTRMWGTSKELTFIMKRPEKNTDVIWNTVDLLIPGVEFNVWSLKDELTKPAINTGMCIYDLAPEQSVTKHLWKNKFNRINQWRRELKYLLCRNPIQNRRCR
ncbi:MAG: hypothetical protein WC598_10115 [Methanoregula sp.]